MIEIFFYQSVRYRLRPTVIKKGFSMIAEIFFSFLLQHLKARRLDRKIVAIIKLYKKTKSKKALVYIFISFYHFKITSICMYVGIKN